MEAMINPQCLCCVHGDKVRMAKSQMPQEEIIYDVGDFFKVLGDSTRIKILYALMQNELCVGDLAESLTMTQPAISHQLRILRQNGLVKFRKDGKTVYYSLDDDHVADILSLGLIHINHKKGID